jgi:hypothetical protein
MRPVLLFSFLFIAFLGKAQGDSTLYNELWKKNRQGMIILSSWGASNIAESMYFTPRTNGSKSYFHQMNGLWNTVNLGLGVAGIIKSHRMLKKPNLADFPHGIMKVEKAYRINFYIDFAYIGTGSLLWGLNQRTGNPNQAKGFGQSILTQGLFLLGFDYIMSRHLRQRIGHKKTGTL